MNSVSAPATVRPFASTALIVGLPFGVLAFLVLLLTAKGPYWLGRNLDPDYAYLMNALNIAVGRPPFHTDHPGTVVQCLGAGVLRAGHAFAGRGSLVSDVVGRPELYLAIINAVLLGFCTAMFVVAGLVARSRLGTIAAMFVVLTPLLSSTLAWNTVCVKPEPAQLGIVAAMAAIMFRRLDCSLTGFGFGDPCLFGVLVGLAIVSKITALPLLLLPLVLLAGWRARATFVGAAVVTVLVALVPAYGHLAPLYGLARGIATHSGRYGLGPEVPFQLLPYGQAVLRVLSGHLIFLVGGTLAAIALLATRSASVHSFGESASRLRRSLSAALASQVASVLVVAHHPWDPRYLTPALALTGTVMAFSVGAFSMLTPSRPHMPARVATLVLVAIGVHQMMELRGLYRNLSVQRDAQETMHREAQRRFPDASFVYYYGASSPAHALHFGDWWAGSRYGREIQNRYPNTRFYNIITKSMEQYDGFVLPPSVDGSFIEVFHGWPLSDRELAQVPIAPPPVLVFSNGLEALYLARHGASGPR